MKDSCLDIGTIQAFLDRELEQAASTRVSDHIAACESCAAQLALAEDETAIVFPALEHEFNTLVPTQRLWTRINDAIETQKRDAPFWQKAWVLLRLSVVSPSLAVAASLVLAIGIFGLIWMNRNAPLPVTLVPTNDVAGTVTPPITVPVERFAAPAPASESTARFERAAYVAAPRRTNTAATVPVRPIAVTPEAMAGEDSYVKTIADLSKTVEGKKDTVLRPSQRIAYERDMAVVDDAIVKMRQEVKRNPKNQSARQVLYTSYQNKIDLLNSVAQKEELMASLQ